MAVYMLDASAVVKRYVAESGTAWVTGVIDPTSGHTPHLARTTLVEVVSAIARRGRGGSLSPQMAAAALSQFQREIPTNYHIVEISPALPSRAMALSEKHALRGYDAVQLAAVLSVAGACTLLGAPPITLISADAELNAAATAEGLAVEDPNDHP